ncbi:MAG: hypothetical protein IJJ33_16610 [Victivallales bacterium]|nr:hypothetical protein [Victivallales bacterium]
MIDFHCHIIPGIDDGSQDMETSLELARQSVADGVSHVVATPHGSSANIKEQLQARERGLAVLRRRLAEERIPLTILPGLEYFADSHSAETALQYPECRVGEPGHSERPILVELPFSLNIGLASNLLFAAQLKGVPLVLAHPERYQGFHQHVSLLAELMDKGLYLQFNSIDLRGGLWGWRLKRAILKLIARNPAQALVGSDAHDVKYRSAGLRDARQAIVGSLGGDVWRLVSWTTPARLLGISTRKEA